MQLQPDHQTSADQPIVIETKRFRITARGIQIALGLLWLLDGLLQLQPQMFTSHFATSVLATASDGQPGVVSAPLGFVVNIILHHPAVYNACFAVTQLLLAGLILWKRTVKIGLLTSVVWGLGVWYIGEGLGGLFGGQTSLLQGAPGAVALYVILALAVLPSSYYNNTKEPAKPAFWLPAVWALLFVGGAIYQLLPGQNQASDIARTIANNADGAPGWLAALDIQISKFIGGQAYFAVFLVVLQALIGILVFYPGKIRKLAVVAGMLLSVVFWFVGQSLGGYFTGLATDPNSGPLFILLGVAVLGCAMRQRYNLSDKI